MRHVNILTIDEINKYYYEEGGYLKRKIKTATNTKEHEIVGFLDKSSGYLRTSLNSKLYLVHRILFQIYHNLQIMPHTLDVDHIDGNKTNNNKDNLRLATMSQNKMNVGKNNNNSSGYKNICHKQSKKKYDHYYVQIRATNKTIRKIFPYTEEGLISAINFRNIKMEELHGEFTNLQ